ncbi:hypothetical protein BGX33_002724 [Mortierella sp. NVP41]|nr:hypothetical protein BGX33_002724 [Mortierella sp. NVP41]
MKVVGLISGGKDSFYNLMQCVANRHTVIALGNLHPKPQDNKDELDSYMYQTVGHDVIHLYKDCLDVPLYRQEIKGKPIEQGSDYVRTEQDETEDLFELLSTVKAAHPDLEAVSVGAILSNYQRIRVESVCSRLGLVALAYLWQRNQEELLYEMAQAGVNAVLIKIAAIGLKRQHLGQSIGDMYPHLVKMNREYDLHICGEGGEYETITLDCPLFKRRIVVEESEVVIHSDDAFAQVAYLRFKKLRLEEKTEDELDSCWMSDINLDPVWEADELMLPIEEIVQSKQASQKHDDSSSKVISQEPAVARDDSLEQHTSKFLSHQSDVVCAIGGTTAFEATSSKSTRHLSIAEETVACLQNVQAKLENIGLSWTEVVFMQVFVANMADFGVVNGAYKGFFGINPPPRACVGTNLPKPCRIQVSCTAIRKGAVSTKPRQTLHVQGMSYWAPANIGPYSQATEQAYHSFIAGQIGMIPSTLDLPTPASLAKETAWSLRNLSQIATVRQSDLANRTALCIVYVKSANDFEAVTAAWEHIVNKKTPPPLLAISVPSLPKGGQVEWQALIHHGKVYAEKAPVSKEDQDGDGYETDDDDMYQVEKRALHPVTLSLGHEPPSTGAGLGASWKTKTQSWFLSPLLTALSVVQVPETSSLASLFSSLSVSDNNAAGNEKQQRLNKETVQDMLAMTIKAMDRILESHLQPEAGPGVEGGWADVVAMSLYYHDTLLDGPELLSRVFDKLLSQYFGKTTNVALTLVPVQAIADRGVLALTVHAVALFNSQSHSHSQQPQQRQQYSTQHFTTQAQNPSVVSSSWTIQAYSVSEKGEKDTVRGSATVGVPTAVARSMLLQGLQFWYRVPIKLFRPMRVDYLVMARAATMGIIPTPANRLALAETKTQLSKRTQFFRATSIGMVAHAVKTQGAGFIYRQVLPPLVMNSFIGSVLYTTYIFTLPVFHPAFTYQKSRTFPPPPFPAVFMAGALAGAAQSLVAAPMDSLKVKFQVQDLAHGGKHKSMASFAITTLKEMGLKTVYRGFALTLVKDSLACGLFFGVFEWVKQQGYYYFIDELYGIREDMELLRVKVQNGYSSSLSSTVPGPPPPTAPSDVASRPYFLLEPTFVLLAGAAAAVAYQAVDYPLEQVKSIFYAKETALQAETLRNAPAAHTQHLNSVSMRSGTSISSQLYDMTWKECKAQARDAGGWRRFLFANFASTAIRAVPAASVGFLVFELMKRKLDARRYESEDREMESYLDRMMAERDAERRAEWLMEFSPEYKALKEREYQELAIN